MQEGNVIDGLDHEQNDEVGADVGADGGDNAVCSVGGVHEVPGVTPGEAREVGGGTG